MRQFPMARDLFRLEEVDWVRLQFTRDGKGRVVSVTGLYDDGRRETNPRG